MNEEQIVYYYISARKSKIMTPSLEFAIQRTTEDYIIVVENQKEKKILINKT